MAEQKYFLQKQRIALEILRKGNEELREELRLESSACTNFVSATAGALLNQLQDESETLTRKIGYDRFRLVETQDRLESLQAKIEAQRRKGGGDGLRLKSIKIMEEAAATLETSRRMEVEYEEEWDRLTEIIRKDRVDRAESRLADSEERERRTEALVKVEISNRDKSSKLDGTITRGNALHDMTLVRMDKLEVELRTVQEAIGIDKASDLAQRLTSAEEQRYRLFTFVQDVYADLERLREECGNLEKSVEKSASDISNRKKSAKIKYKSLQEELQKRTKNADVYTSRMSLAAERVDEICTLAARLYDTVEEKSRRRTLQDERVDGLRDGLDQKTNDGIDPTVVGNERREDDGVKPYTVLRVLGAAEQKILEYFQTFHWVILGIFAALIYRSWDKRRRSQCYILDHECYTMKEHQKIHYSKLLGAMKNSGLVYQENIDFMERIMGTSGICETTAYPEVVHDSVKASARVDENIDVRSREETEMIMEECVSKLLKKAGIDAKEIDIVMTTCCCYAPFPSMASMLINQFKLKPTVLSYHFGGMGCAASTICIDLAARMMRSQPNQLCLVFNHENISSQWYAGNEKTMMIVSSLFRMGGCAALLSNRPQDMHRVKYRVGKTLRNHYGANDESFGCMGQTKDKEGYKGTFVLKTTVSTAGRSLSHHLKKFAPSILSYEEMFKAVWYRKEKYLPKFGKCVDHVLLHPGGARILDLAMEKLNFSEKQIKPATETLYRFGNLSAASTWYVLSRIEGTTGVKRGESLWSLSFGGGFKVNSAMFKAVRDVYEEHDCWKGFEGMPAREKGVKLGTEFD